MSAASTIGMEWHCLMTCRFVKVLLYGIFEVMRLTRDQPSKFPDDPLLDEHNLSLSHRGSRLMVDVNRFTLNMSIST
jgi:hypothetical protein